ncbi:MAG: protein kinase [Elusimicrobia bacterium]|nr:protein kinase [Elusimicrobiota bacterium]
MASGLLLLALASRLAAGGPAQDCGTLVQAVLGACASDDGAACMWKFLQSAIVCQSAAAEAMRDFDAAQDRPAKLAAQQRFDEVLRTFDQGRLEFTHAASLASQFHRSLVQTQLDAITRSYEDARNQLAAMKEEMEQPSEPPAASGPAPTQEEGPAAEETKVYRAAGTLLEDLSGSAGEKAPEVLKDAGESYLRANSPDDAHRVLSAATRERPDDAQAQGMLAAALAGQGRYKESLARARKALSLDPEEPRAKDIASALESSLPKEASRWDLSRVGFAETGRAAAGRAADEGPGDVRQAAADGRTGQGSGSAAPEADSKAARLLRTARRKLMVKDLEGALLDAARAVQADPKDARSLALRAAISNQLKNHGSALADAEAALLIDPVSLDALLEKSLALYELGRYEEALAAAHAALGLSPQSGLGRLYSAMAKEKLGLAAQALEDYRRAAELDASLKPLFLAAARRLAGPAAAGPAGPAPRLGRWAWRAGSAAAAALLILMGVFAAREITKRRLVRPETPAGPRPMGTLPPGARLAGNYRVVRELGRGGMGVVYEAFDEALERRVAIKQLRRELHYDREGLGLFLREARLVAKLKHPNIVEIHAVVEEEEPFLVFDLVEGETLSERLARRGRLPLPEVCTIISPVAAAVGFAHGRRIIHRDLKPSNIMISEDGGVRVMDFGIAHQSRGAAGSTVTSISGTPQYMAPEQELGSASPQSDLFSLGVVAYELLTGRLPFPGPDFGAQKRAARFEPASAREPSLGPGFDPFFAKALSPCPEKRFEDASEFLKGLRSAVGAAAA